MLPGGWALLGERGKGWARAAGACARCASAAALRVELRGSEGELVELDVLEPAHGTARSVRVVLGAGGVGTVNTVGRT